MESTPPLSTPEEELAYLREQVTRKEAELAKRATPEERVRIVSETIHEHHAAPREVLASEYRISNFLLWQISYSEIWVSEKYWPEFREDDLRGAIRDFARRDRRYGGLSPVTS